MKLPGKRQLNLLGFATCTGLMAFALYSQYQLFLDPCPLCVFQRMAVIGIGVLCLIAALHNPDVWGSRAYALLIGLGRRGWRGGGKSPRVVAKPAGRRGTNLRPRV